MRITSLPELNAMAQGCAGFIVKTTCGKKFHLSTAVDGAAAVLLVLCEECGTPTFLLQIAREAYFVEGQYNEICCMACGGATWECSYEVKSAKLLLLCACGKGGTMQVIDSFNHVEIEA